MEFSIVCGWKDLGDPARRASYEWTRDYWRRHFPDAEIVEESPEPFSLARALNDAVRRASCNVILHADPDVIVSPEQAQAAVMLAGEADGLVVPFEIYRFLTEQATKDLHELVLRRETTALEIASWFGDEDCEFSGEGGAGLVTAFSRQTWWLARGYDERFGMWGGEDVAFAFACAAFAGPWRRLPGVALHSWHPRLPESAPIDPRYVDQFAIIGEYRDAEARGMDAVRELVLAR